MKQQKLDTVLFKALILTAIGMVVTQTQGMSDLTSNLFLLTFPLTVVLWLRSVRKSFTMPDLLMLLTAALALVGVMINCAATNTMPGFSYIRKLIMFVMTIMFFQTAYRVRVERSVKRFLDTLVDLLTVYLIVLFLSNPLQMYTMNGRISAYLTFRLSNSNLTALVLSCLYMLELYRVFTPEPWFLRLIHIVLAVFLAMFVVLTQSRNAIIILSFYTFACGWLMLRGKEGLTFHKGWATVVSVFPAVFVAVYLAVVETPWIQNIFSFLVGTGKGLNSRVRIWNRALGHLFSSPLVGAYSQISYGTGTSQMHNSHLDIACSYGIPVLILVCVLLWQYLYQKGRRYDNKAEFCYILGFACAIMLGMGEAALFSGGLGIYVLAGGFLLRQREEL